MLRTAPVRYVDVTTNRAVKGGMLPRAKEKEKLWDGSMFMLTFFSLRIMQRSGFKCHVGCCSNSKGWVVSASPGWLSHLLSGFFLPLGFNRSAKTPFQIFLLTLIEAEVTSLTRRKQYMCVTYITSLSPHEIVQVSSFKWRACAAWSVLVLFSTIHPLNVFLVVCFELLALQFERISDQTSLWCPGFSAQPDLLGNLKPLQFAWLEESRTKSPPHRCS